MIVVTTEGAGYFDSTYLLNAERKRRQALLVGWEAADDVTHHLILAADQFLVNRRSPDGQETRKSLIAGYHWFEDWGRDTLIALPGLLLVTGRHEEAGEILKTYAAYTNEGIVPNRFPDTGGDPEYNTVDASLWFIIAAFHYIRYTKDFDFVRDHLWPTMKDIIAHYQNGTRFHIRMDLDGLIYAGQTGAQLTWMDAKVGDQAITPRTGKPVEIQALWYNALRIMDQLGNRMGEKEAAKKWMGLAEKVWASINSQILCMKRVDISTMSVNGEEKDASLRPNQILAVSLPFESVTPDRAARIVALRLRRSFSPLLVCAHWICSRTRGMSPHYKGDPGHSRRRLPPGHRLAMAHRPVFDRLPESEWKVRQSAVAYPRASSRSLLTHLWESGLGTVS